MRFRLLSIGALAIAAFAATRLYGETPVNVPPPLRTIGAPSSPAMAGPAMSGPAMTGPAMSGPAMAGPAMTGDAGGDAVGTLVVAGGCFWGVQGVYQHVKGVLSAVSGYAGGPAGHATYPEVSTGTTGHAEAVRITFDRHRVDAGTLLQVFFSVVHDPTQRDRQGPDVGTQYRSAVFTDDPAAADAIHAYIHQLDQAGIFAQPVATTVEPVGSFTPAEAYHQDYLTRHPDQLYIEINDLPKVAALKRQFPALYAETPVLVAASH